MAITNTKIADLVGSEKLLANMVNMFIREQNELVTGGVLITSPEVDDRAKAGGPRKSSLPFLLPLATDEYNISTDDITVAGNVGKLTGDEFSVVRHDVNYGWGTAALTRMVTQYEAQGGIRAGMGEYWNNIIKQIAFKSLEGAVAGSYYDHDEDGGTTPEVSDLEVTKTGGFDISMVIDAAAEKKGVLARQMDTMIVHPLTYALMQKANAGNSFVPASESNIGFDTFKGYKLVRSDTFVSATKTIVCGAGSLAFGLGTHDTPMEIERIANGGAGGGGDILHSRQSFIVHPQGFNYVGSVAPNLAALATGSNWELAIDAAKVPLLVIKHD